MLPNDAKTALQGHISALETWSSNAETQVSLSREDNEQAARMASMHAACAQALMKYVDGAEGYTPDPPPPPEE